MMKLEKHSVTFSLGKHGIPLQSAASRILSKVGISSISYVERPLANQDVDFYWRGQLDGVEYQVRGSSWDPKEPQASITVTMVGHNASTQVKLLTENAVAGGWRHVKG